MFLTQLSVPSQSANVLSMPACNGLISSCPPLSAQLCNGMNVNEYLPIADAPSDNEYLLHADAGIDMTMNEPSQITDNNEPVNLPPSDE
jgi:hypothetical protein